MHIWGGTKHVANNGKRFPFYEALDTKINALLYFVIAFELSLRRGLDGLSDVDDWFIHNWNYLAFPIVNFHAYVKLIHFWDNHFQGTWFGFYKK